MASVLLGEGATRQMSATAPYVVLAENANECTIGEHHSELAPETLLATYQISSQNYDTAYIKTVSGDIYRLRESPDGGVTIEMSRVAAQKEYCSAELGAILFKLGEAMQLPDDKLTSPISEIVVTKQGRRYNANVCSEMPSSDIADQFESDWSLALVRKAEVC